MAGPGGGAGGVPPRGPGQGEPLCHQGARQTLPSRQPHHLQGTPILRITRVLCSFSDHWCKWFLVNCLEINFLGFLLFKFEKLSVKIELRIGIVSIDLTRFNFCSDPSWAWFVELERGEEVPKLHFFTHEPNFLQRYNLLSFLYKQA